MTCRPPNSRKSNCATEPQIERLGLQMLPHPLPKGPQGRRGATHVAHLDELGERLAHGYLGKRGTVWCVDVATVMPHSDL
jgi:hypothetical protein